MTKEKKVYLEILRIWSLMGVIFCHTSVYGYLLFYLNTESVPMYWLNMIIGCLERACIPVFFMISGALLLPKEESIRDIYKKRVLRTGLILLSISGFYCLYYNHIYPDRSRSLSEFLKIIYQEEYITPLYFLYLYLAFLILLPLLRKFAASLGTKEYQYMMLLALVFTYVVKITNFFMDGDLDIILFILDTNILYVFLGYYFDHVMTKEHYTKRGCVLLGVMCAGSILLTGIMSQLSFMKNGEYGENFIISFFMIPAMFVFYFVTYLFKYRYPIDTSRKVGKVIAYLGSCTFCGYLLEEVLRNKYIGIYEKLGGQLHPYLIFPIYAFLMLSSIVIISSILKVIPIVKKLRL